MTIGPYGDAQVANKNHNECILPLNVFHTIWQKYCGFKTGWLHLFELLREHSAGLVRYMGWFQRKTLAYPNGEQKMHAASQLLITSANESFQLQ